LTYGFPPVIIVRMNIRNVVFDAGGVLLEWDPPSVIAGLYPDPVAQAEIRRQIFEHPDWHEYDRGALTEAAASEHFAKLSGRSPEEVRKLLRATCESLRPIDGTIKLLEELAAGGVNLFLLSNMPVSTFDFLIKRDHFFAHFKQLVISGQILLLKPEPAIYKHLVEKTGIVPAESVFIDDLLRNVIAARESGLHAIQFRDPASCRAELRTYLPDIGL
jgi:HAD superfamily hydrolase (TIGR01509 family)